MAKERQRRMDKTLGCLVASMTLGALVLYYTQPELPATQGKSRFLIAEPSVWHAIHIDPEAIMADQPAGSAHFYVDQSGEWAKTGLWTHQQRLTGEAPLRDTDGQEAASYEQVIRIGLITPSGSYEITEAQHARASLLVQELSERFGIASERIIWDDTLNIPAPEPTSRELRPDLSRSR